jgi:hypothetical protein
MRRLILPLLLVVLMSPAVRSADPPPIDWERARNLYQRERAGEKLSPEDQAYLDHAKAERQNRQNAGQPRAAAAPRESIGLIPLTNKLTERYKGFTLGLYGDSQNAPPADHLKRAKDAAGKITPVDADGRPAAAGKIVLMSLGMSNTTQEFSRFVQLANADKSKNPALVVVDAAQGGRAADDWTDPKQPTYEQAEKRLIGVGVTAKQVQVLWVKQARKGPAQLGEFPKHAEALESDLKQIVLAAKQRYPNLQLIYLSSRTYGGYATTPLNPEPYAYESAFSVQWLIRKQIDGKDADLAYEISPVLLWGPYLWTDGTKGREGDDFVWKKEDTAADGTHPSPTSGRQKVADLLLAFFKSDSTAKPWFCMR